MFTIFFLGFSALQAQVGLGQWKDYLPWQKGQKVIQVDNLFYMSTNSGVLLYDEEDGSVQKISKLNGLPSTQISDIGYHSPSSTFIITFLTSEIVTIREGKLSIDLSIQQASILGDKSIRRIRIIDNKVYLCTGFGVILYDPAPKNVLSTYLIGAAPGNRIVNDLMQLDNEFLCLTTTGLYKADLASNLDNPNNWRLWNGSPASSKEFHEMVAVRGAPYLVEQQPFLPDTVQYFDGQNWITRTELLGRDVHEILTEKDRILVVQDGDFTFYDFDWNRLSNVFTLGNDVGIDPRHVIASDNYFYVVADHTRGLALMSNEFNAEVINLGGPAFQRPEKIAVSEDEIAFSSGSRSSIWLPTFNGQGVTFTHDGEWKQIAPFDLKDTIPTGDFYDITFDNKDGNKFWVSSIQRGLFEVNDGELSQYYTDVNSSLTPSTSDPKRIITSALNQTDNGDLLVTLLETPLALSKKNESDEWETLDLLSVDGSQRPSDIIEAADGRLWITMDRNGLLVYDYNETFADNSDDQFRVLTQTDGNGGLVSNSALCITEDNSGAIWIGTEAGLSIFNNPSSVQPEGFINADEIIVSQDGFNGILLEDELIWDIKIDAANRKWIATLRNGVFCLSPDGKEQIYHFTAENSPLLDNDVRSIAIRETTGEVFFGTDQGLISFRAEATNTGAACENVVVYPNPVRPTFDGTIGINGIAFNSPLKITDSGGFLIAEGFSTGNQYAWNGRNQNGEKVQTGVYLVHSINDNGESCISRVLIAN